MSSPNITHLLNRLLGIISRSFPQYLQFSRPYIPPGRKEVVETLESIVTDQSGIEDRICQMIQDADQLPRRGEFPMEFTDVHDLGIDYLLQASIGYQQQDIVSISELVEQLQLAPAAKSLAEEALGMAKGHLQSLQEMVEELAKS